MPPSSNTSWTPSAGRHQLNIGSSLGRALRARKNNAPGPAKRNVLPEREFYSVRYGHKPRASTPPNPAPWKLIERPTTHLHQSL
ncbi:hypothetical protein C8R42DRAFT_286451 [Lentinula raphanica]|nr:hypothetical protein C8R42DRAFT_286451 [Lentinula raphanica]